MRPGPTDLVTRAEAAYQTAVADPATAGPVAETVVAEARRAGDIEAEIVALRRRPGVRSARSWPRSARGGCSPGPPDWLRRLGSTIGWPRSSS